MELLLLIVESVVSFLDLVALTVDVYSWIRGKDNRVERRNARRAGIVIPPRDRWNRRVIASSIFVIALTAALVTWKLK